MPDNIVVLDDYRKSKEKEDKCWAAIMNADPEKVKKLIADIMRDEPTIEEKINDSTISVTRMLINELYQMQANPEDAQLADDMAFITMLYTAAVEEFFTEANKNKTGNEIYQYLVDMKEKVLN